jgi:hypothetical protein
MIKRFNGSCHTKFVLKTAAVIWFYVGGKRPFYLSANTCFFGVNIAVAKEICQPILRETLLKTLIHAFNGHKWV